jgi:hypothetical protein
MTARTLPPSPKTNAAKPQPWPKRALGVLEDTLARLVSIVTYAKKMNKHMTDIDSLAEQGIEAVHNRNWVLAERLFVDIKRDAASQRHLCVDICAKANDAKAALAAARVGEYGEG